MDNIRKLKDLFESVPRNKKIALLMFLIKKDVDILLQCGFLKNDTYCLCIEFEKKLKNEE